MDEWQLLRQYVEDNSQAAFARLVERYINLVYSTCLREVRDPIVKTRGKVDQFTGEKEDHKWCACEPQAAAKTACGQGHG